MLPKKSYKELGFNNIFFFAGVQFARHPGSGVYCFSYVLTNSLTHQLANSPVRQLAN